jgi:SulP family sulfate permease
VGIEQAVAVAVALSLADRARRSARPRDTVRQRRLPPASVRHLDRAAATPVQVPIFDADGMFDVDCIGLASLRDLIVELGEQHITVAMARASHLVHHDLKHGDLLDELGYDRLYASVEEAVAALRP